MDGGLIRHIPALPLDHPCSFLAGVSCVPFKFLESLPGVQRLRLLRSLAVSPDMFARFPFGEFWLLVGAWYLPFKTLEPQPKLLSPDMFSRFSFGERSYSLWVHGICPSRPQGASHCPDMFSRFSFGERSYSLWVHVIHPSKPWSPSQCCFALTCVHASRLVRDHTPCGCMVTSRSPSQCCFALTCSHVSHLVRDHTPCGCMASALQNLQETQPMLLCTPSFQLSLPNQSCLAPIPPYQLGTKKKQSLLTTPASSTHKQEAPPLYDPCHLVKSNREHHLFTIPAI